MSFKATSWGFESDTAEDWRKQARCADPGIDAELFFPIGNTTPAIAQTDAAKAVCNRCPVRIACRDWALDRPHTEGVWGGTSTYDRRAIRRHRRKTGVTS